MNATDRIRAELAHWHETGELPPAWEPEPTEAPEIDDARLDEMMREREAIDSGYLDFDDAALDEMMREREAIEAGCVDACPLHCRRPCCRPAGWEP